MKSFWFVSSCTCLEQVKKENKEAGSEVYLEMASRVQYAYVLLYQGLMHVMTLTASVLAATFTSDGCVCCVLNA